MLISAALSLGLAIFNLRSGLGPLSVVNVAVTTVLVVLLNSDEVKIHVGR